MLVVRTFTRRVLTPWMIAAKAQSIFGKVLAKWVLMTIPLHSPLRFSKLTVSSAAVLLRAKSGCIGHEIHRGYDFGPCMSAKWPFWSSVACRMREPPGTSMGGSVISPPASITRFWAASMLSTVK